MTTALPTGVALLMSGVPTTEEGELLLVDWYRLVPPFRRDGRSSLYAVVAPTGIWECDYTGRLTGCGRLLSHRHGTPAEDLLALGYGASEVTR